MKRRVSATTPPQVATVYAQYGVAMSYGSIWHPQKPATASRIKKRTCIGVAGSWGVQIYGGFGRRCVARW
jgi:hypothetical protein